MIHPRTGCSEGFRKFSSESYKGFASKKPDCKGFLVARTKKFKAGKIYGLGQFIGKYFSMGLTFLDER